jgi:hypothetical protein
VTSAPTTAPRARKPLVEHPGRVLVVVLMLGAVVTLLVWGLTSTQTGSGPTRNAPTAPSSIESLSPGAGELAQRQETISVDLRDDLTGVLLVQPPDRAGFEVPEDQLDRIVPLGQLSWRPGTDQELERFEAGTYRLTVLYWPQDKPRPESPTGYTWEFRVGV